MKRFTYLLSALFIILLSANASPVKTLKNDKKADAFEPGKAHQGCSRSRTAR